MSHDDEDIEARLCAYVDGELPPTERARIVQYLAANPSHAALLAELTAQRKMLSALPREKAPPQIADFFRTQLEREALLGKEPLAEEPGIILKLRRWPQLMSAAAIILLAIGLAAVVYFVLPTGPAYTIAPQPQNVISPLRTTPEPVADNTAPARPAPVPQVAMPDLAEGAMKLKADDFFANPDNNQVLVIKVQAEDLKQANEEVVKYLASNNIPWSEPQPEVLAQLTLNGSPVPASRSRRTGLTGEIVVQHATAQPDLAAAQRPAESALAPTTQPTGESTTALANDTVAFGTDPAQQADPEVRAMKGGMGGFAANDAALPGPADISQPMRQLTLANSEITTSRVIFARNLNGQQVTELATRLSRTQQAIRAPIGRDVVVQVAQSTHLYKRLEPAGQPQSIPTTQPAQLMEKTLAFGGPADSPTTRPAIAEETAQSQAIQEPAAQLLTDAPTTRPADSSAYNCVIVLEVPETPADTPATQPTTQPAPIEVNAPATQPGQ